MIGSWNGGDISIQEKNLRDDINLPGQIVLSDSAFPASGELFGRIMTPLKEGELEKASTQCRPALMVISEESSKARQVVSGA